MKNGRTKSPLYKDTNFINVRIKLWLSQEFAQKSYNVSYNYCYMQADDLLLLVLVLYESQQRMNPFPGMDVSNFQPYFPQDFPSRQNISPGRGPGVAWERNSAAS